MSPPTSLQPLATGLDVWRQLNGLLVASATIMVMDWLLTLPLEVSLIWTTRWSLLKILFLLARYIPFVYIPILIYHQFAPGVQPGRCQVIYDFAVWILITGIGCAELILTIRTRATVENSKAVAYFFPLFVLTYVTIYVLLGLWMKTIHETSSIPGLGMGCLIESKGINLAAVWILIMVYDAGNLFLMIIQGIRIFKFGDVSQLSRIVYIDGIIYYICLFCLSLTNALIIFLLPTYHQLLAVMEGVVHSALACRVVLNIRANYNTGLENGTSISTQPMQFANGGTSCDV